MSKRFKYDVPLLVDLSAESALGGCVCSGFGGDASDYNCQEGSCPVSSQCSGGSYAQWCYGGAQAHNTSDPNCVSCCQSGTGVTAPAYACACSSGTGAVMTCTSYGGNATQDCTSGGNYGYGLCM